MKIFKIEAIDKGYTICNHDDEYNNKVDDIYLIYEQGTPQCNDAIDVLFEQFYGLRETDRHKQTFKVVDQELFSFFILKFSEHFKITSYEE